MQYFYFFSSLLFYFYFIFFKGFKNFANNNNDNNNNNNNNRMQYLNFPSAISAIWKRTDSVFSKMIAETDKIIQNLSLLARYIYDNYKLKKFRMPTVEINDFKSNTEIQDNDHSIRKKNIENYGYPLGLSWQTKT